MIYNTILNKREIPGSKRYKLWWGCSAGNSGAYVRAIVRPTHIGMTVAWHLGNPGSARTGSLGVAVPYTNPGGNATIGLGFSTGYTNVAAQGGTQTQQGGAIPSAATIVCDNQSSYESNRISQDVVTGRNGTVGTVYNSWSPPGVTPGSSTYDNTYTGPGAGGGNNIVHGGWSPIAAQNGLIKVTVVGE